MSLAAVCCRLKCIGSWCYLHNQTGNILTHGVGFVVFLHLLVDLAVSVYQRTGCVSDALSLIPLTIGCLGVFTFSTLFHTFRCNSEHDCDHFNKLDYSGIVLSTWGAVSTMILNAFRCNTKWMLVYLISCTVTAALVVLVILRDSFADTKYRALRPVPFALQMFVGTFASLPRITAIVLNSCPFANFRCRRGPVHPHLVRGCSGAHRSIPGRVGGYHCFGSVLLHRCAIRFYLGRLQKRTPP